jgi:hypothetical protein
LRRLAPFFADFLAAADRRPEAARTVFLSAFRAPPFRAAAVFFAALRADAAVRGRFADRFAAAVRALARSAGAPAARSLRGGVPCRAAAFARAGFAVARGPEPVGASPSAGARSPFTPRAREITPEIVDVMPVVTDSMPPATVPSAPPICSAACSSRLSEVPFSSSLSVGKFAIRSPGPRTIGGWRIVERIEGADPSINTRGALSEVEGQRIRVHSRRGRSRALDAPGTRRSDTRP